MGFDHIARMERFASDNAKRGTRTPGALSRIMVLRGNWRQNLEPPRLRGKILKIKAVTVLNLDGRAGVRGGVAIMGSGVYAGGCEDTTTHAHDAQKQSSAVRGGCL